MSAEDDRRFAVDGYMHSLEYDVDGRLGSVRYFDLSLVDQETSEVEHSRTGGPAVIYLRHDGTVENESYLYRGRKHRIDGPASIEYDESGVVKKSRWFFRGTTLRLLDGEGMGFILGKLLRLPFSELIEELERSSYGVLLVEGHRPEKILDVLDDGVTTADGIREVLGGAPPDWVRSFEEGASR